MRKYAVLYYKEIDQWAVMFQDTGESTWYIYSTVNNQIAAEKFVEALNDQIARRS